MAPKGPEISGGVNSTLSPVNSESKYLVSVSLVTKGLKTGVICNKQIKNIKNLFQKRKQLLKV